MLGKFNKPQNEQFGLEFLKRYFNRGFGNMTKNDFEVLIFDLLKNIDPAGKNNSIHQWSIDLRIPESKVKKLLYEANIIYHDYDENTLRQEFFAHLASNFTKFSSDNKKIQFAVENPTLRSMIDADLKSLGYFADASFNKEIVSIELKAFSALLLYYYPQDFKQKIVEECEKQMSSQNNNFKIDPAELFKEFILQVVKSTGKILPELLAKLILGYTSPVTLLTEVIKAIPSLIKVIQK